VLVAHKVVEDHEVGQQDLVHAADRLEAVQVVLGRLALDVGRFVGQQLAGRMDALTGRFQDAGDRVLGEPVDLQVGVELAQLGGDRDVPLGVPEPDRRGDVERPPATGLAAHPAPWRRCRLDEVAQQQIDPDRIADVRRVAGALQQH
jgi:hypothetical protein